MRRRWRWVVAMTVLVALLLSLGNGVDAAAWRSGDWWTRGGTDTRQNVTHEDLGPLEAFQEWAVELGPSTSQPLFIDGLIYHMAGNGLWEVDPGRLDADGTPAVRSLIQGINTWPEATPPLNYRPSTSYLTAAQVVDDLILFFGTGSNRVCAYNVATGTARCRQLGGMEPVVSAPLVFTPEISGRVADVVIMGDKAGGLWVIQGLATAGSAGEVKAHRYSVLSGAWVTPSPVPATDSSNPSRLAFIWAADGVASAEGNGLIARFRVVPADVSGDLRVETEWVRFIPGDGGGIADGLTADGDYVYVASKRGDLIRAHSERGVLTYIGPPGPMFANAMAAVGNEHVYFAVRNASSSRPDREDPGQIIAVRKDQWTDEGVAWRSMLPAPVNTSPLVWLDQELVLVGDTKGKLYAFDERTGAPRSFARTRWMDSDLCLPVPTVDFVREDEDPFEADHAYQQLSGLATDPALSTGGTGTGLLLAGVNTKRTLTGLDGSPEETVTGRIAAYRAADTYNIRWLTDGRDITPAEPLAIGSPTSLRGDVTQIGGRNRTTEIWWFYVSEDGTRVRLLDIHENVDLTDGKVVSSAVTYTPRAEDEGEGQIIGVANPGPVLFHSAAVGDELRELLAEHALAAGMDDVARQLMRYSLDNAGDVAASVLAQWTLSGDCRGEVAESELIPGQGVTLALLDNFLTIPVRIQGAPLDLEVVRVEAPVVHPYVENGQYTVRWLVRNHGDQSLTVRRVVTARTDPASRTWTPRQGSFSYAPGDTWEEARVSIGRGDRDYIVRVEVNPDRTIAESTYENNAGTAITRLGAEPVSGAGDWAAGESQTLIVPPDCDPNPDRTSPQPCLNYPEVVAPWYCRENLHDRRCEAYRR